MANFKNLIVAFALLIMLMGGCAKDQQGGVSKLPENQANSLSAEHSKFEQSKDPPFTAATCFAAGQLAESQEAPLAAIAQYQAALRIDPHHRDSLYRLGVLHTRLKEWSSAIGAWKKYLRETKSDATAFANLGFCYDLAGRKADA